MSSRPYFPFADSAIYARRKVHLGITGSIACYKICDLIRLFHKMEINLTATLTNGAKQFITPLLLNALGVQKVYGDMFEYDGPFDHLEPGQMADCMAIVPASANTLARIANGLADDMLAAQFLANESPVVLAPAMNPKMWSNPATQNNMSKLAGRGCKIVGPGYGATACGDVGEGRLADLEQIAYAILKSLSPQDLADKKVLITFGPTREYFDAVRYWSNPSSGKMGACLATAAWLRGGEVTAICGPGVEISLPEGIKLHSVTSAHDMLKETAKVWTENDLGIFCAAVADFTPADHVNGKFKKAGHSNLQLTLTATQDILLHAASHRKESQKILGFAAEAVTEPFELLPLAHLKLQSKQADIIAANQITGARSSFGSASASMVIADRNGREEIWQEQSKADIAWELISWLLKI